MIRLKMVRAFTAPPQKAWDAIQGFDLNYFGKYTPPTDIEGKGLGCTRTVSMPDGTLVEKIEHYDSAQMTLGYTMVTGPYPVKNYHAEIKVSPNDEGCEVAWSATFEAEGSSGEKAAETMEGVLKLNLKSLGKFLA